MKTQPSASEELLEIAAQDLLDAVQRQDATSVQSLLACGANVNATSRNGWTPLMLAILFNSHDIAELLLAAHANPNLTTASEENPGRSPLVVAVLNGRLEMVQLLLTHGADARLASHGTQPLLALARKLSVKLLPPPNIDAIIVLLEKADTA